MIEMIPATLRAGTHTAQVAITATVDYYRDEPDIGIEAGYAVSWPKLVESKALSDCLQAYVKDLGETDGDLELDVDLTVDGRSAGTTIHGGMVSGRLGWYWLAITGEAAKRVISDAFNAWENAA